MAQPNVAREPSMDEILASIRKIIENNEAMPELAPDADGDEGFHITTDSHSGNLMDHPAVVERFHSEEHRPSAIQPIQRAEPAHATQPALSLADVAARVRAASERHVANREPEVEPVSIEPVQLPLREENPVMTSRMTANASRFVPPVEAVEKREPFVEKHESVTPHVEPTPVVETRVAEPVGSGRDISALVSPAVGERVAQSFGALAQAMDAGPRRSFDEIAEEMLRPMLQEWLDDNLPTLVERLVREEIERVARGPRR
ncbi:PopZ family protein [Shinella sp. BE166]|uniref:PopZ family protein n=1 Tax=Shinella sp. BE166 TaxID=3373918 RepID=UPI003EBE1FAD